jgi:hypothetical protein
VAIKHWLALRLRNQYPMLQYFTDRGFGVEMEIYGLDYVVTPVDGGVIKPYNISSRGTDGRRFRQLYLDHGVDLGANRESWHFEEDGSITGRGGVELISPILSGLEGLVQTYHALQFLGDMKGVKINESCGFHVHHGVDRQQYTCAHLKELVRIIYPMEEYFYLLIPGDRQNADTCRPIEVDIDSFLQECEGDCDPTSCRIQNLWYSAENRYDIESAKYPRYDKTRYHGLNLHSYWYRSTIEFRYHSAVLHDLDEAMQWIIFTQFLIEMSQGHFPTLYFYPGANKWLQTIYKIYLAFGYLDRIKRLSN